MIKGSDYYRIEKAIHFLSENVDSQPSLKDLSDFLGLSEFHCHRLFKKWAGVTPKDFLQIITLSKAKALLRDSSNLLDTSLRVGLSGSSRLHDLFLRYEAMTPGDYKNGGSNLEISWTYFASPVGGVSLGVTEKGVCALSFVDSKAEALESIMQQWPQARFSPAGRSSSSLVKEINARMLGEKSTQIKLFVKGTPFQVKVWEALLRVPEGKMTTYQGIANLIGSPKAVRAVGSAIGANPVGYLIPCHRVIKSTGAIGEYHWGSARKTALLAMER